MIAAILLPLFGLLAVGTMSVYLQPRFLMDIVARAYPEVVFTVRTDEKVIALTIDDAPTSKDTPLILDILREHGVRATFFCIGHNILHEDPTREIMHRMVEEGHEIANHMFKDTPSYQLSDAEFTKELVEVDALLEEVLSSQDPTNSTSDPSAPTNSTAPSSSDSSASNDTQALTNSTSSLTRGKKWFRPGHGFFTRKMVEQARKYGYTTALGDCYPHDPAISLSSVNTYYLLNRVHPGAIIILHNRPWTLATLSTAIPQLKAMGYTITTLTELSKYDTTPRTRTLQIKND